MRGLQIRLAAIALAILTAACDTIPAEQVQFYADSYAEANSAGNRLYDELVEPIGALKVATDAPSAPSAPVETQEFPARFEPADFVVTVSDGLRRPGESDDVAVRRAAMKVITDYNAIMVRLASGQTAAEVSRQTNALADHLGGVLGLFSLDNPVTGVVADSIGRLAAFAESLRADAELRAALIAGQEPVADLIDALREDTEVMYDIYRPYHESGLLGLERKVNDISHTIADFVASHSAPGDSLAGSLSGLRQRFAAARRTLPGFDEMALATRASGRAYDQAANDSLALMVDQLEATVAEHRAKVARINAYYGALGVYARLLDQVKQTNTGLVDAARRRTVTLDPVKVITTATAIRRDAETILAGL